MNDLLRLSLEISIICPDLRVETFSTLDSTATNFIMGEISVVDPGFVQVAGNTYNIHFD